jgi:hypothetical protein
MAQQRDSRQSRGVSGEKNHRHKKEEKENEKDDWHSDVVRSCDVGGSGRSKGSKQHCAGCHDKHQESDQKAREESEIGCETGGCAHAHGYPQQVVSSRKR